MDQLKVFKNDIFEVRAALEDGTVLFDAETVARCLGFTQTQNKNGKLYTSTRWETINAHLEKYFPTKLGKGDMIPEPMVYKLAFKASNDTAEKFQDWLAIEVIPQIRKTGSYIPDASALSPELALMNALVAQMNKDAQHLARLQVDVQETKNDLQEMRDVIEITPFDNWREDTNKQLNKICIKTGEFKETKNKIYEALDRRARVDVKRRLENMKARALVSGMARSKVDALSRLDVIAEDQKLIEIYTAIVKEMAIKKGVA